jgi:hypothetical protein
MYYYQGNNNWTWVMTQVVELVYNMHETLGLATIIAKNNKN